MIYSKYFFSLVLKAFDLINHTDYNQQTSDYALECQGLLLFLYNIKFTFFVYQILLDKLFRRHITVFC